MTTTNSPVEQLARWSDHSSAFLAMNTDTRHFTSDDVPGMIAYGIAGRRHLIQLCGPFAPPGCRRDLLNDFRAWARAQQRKVTAIQLTRAEAAEYATEGFTVNQFGSSYSVDLSRFSLSGGRFVKVRNKISRALRQGVKVAEVPLASPRLPSIEERLEEIDRMWLRAKGRLARRLVFMVGERGGRGHGHRRLFLATQHDGIIAYVTFSPVYGARQGWLYDLTRRSYQAPPGTIEAIISRAITIFTAEGCQWLHFGFTPCTDLQPELEFPGHSAAMRLFIEFLAKHGDHLYPARSQVDFKRKWQPQIVEPEYIAFDGRADPAAIFRLLHLVRAL